MGNDDDFLASTIRNMTDEQLEAFCNALQEDEERQTEREKQHD